MQSFQLVVIAQIVESVQVVDRLHLAAVFELEGFILITRALPLLVLHLFVDLFMLIVITVAIFFALVHSIINNVVAINGGIRIIFNFFHILVILRTVHRFLLVLQLSLRKLALNLLNPELLVALESDLPLLLDGLVLLLLLLSDLLLHPIEDLPVERQIANPTQLRSRCGSPISLSA